MEFGIFDHLDRGVLPLAEYYEARLKVIEAFDSAGFYAYHLAEHHSTPLGMSPSPSVFLAAVAQRTRRLRFGPLVYPLPLYHPLRLIEEICMLDHLSGGRLEIGFGRGASPIELAFYGQDMDTAQQVFNENFEIVLKGLREKSLDFEGTTRSFTGVPMELAPLQRPHPPIWMGTHSPESAERAARRGFNIVSNDSPAGAQAVISRYRQVWREIHGETKRIPRLGIVRFVLVAETDEEALASARRAYPKWQHAFSFLYRQYGMSPMHGERAPDFDSVRDKEGKGIAGSPNTVAAYLQSHLAETSANYLVGQFSFGDLSLAEMLRSVDLFAKYVMPQLRKNLAASQMTRG